MGSEGSHSTQNDTPLAHSAKQRKKEGKRVLLQAKVDELEAQNNKIAMRNEVLQEQYEKLFETLHEARQAQTRELVAPVEVNHQLGALQHGGSHAFDIDIPDREQITPRLDNQHEASLNPVASTRTMRSGGRHLFAEGAEGSKAVFRDCRDFLKQRRENSIHISSKINDPRISERLGPLPRPEPATNLGKGQQVLERHEGTGDSEVFRQTYPGSQYNESREKSHALDQTFLIPRGDGDLRKKAPVAHNSAQDPLVLQLLEEVNKLKAERQAEIPDWNQPRPGPLTRRILNTPLQAKTKQKLGLQLYTGKEDPIEHLNLFESTMAYRMHTDEERCLLFPSTLSGGALNWYCRLTPETVDSFEELRKLFVSQHIFQTDRLHSADDLYTIRQKPDESLRMYAGRFSHEYSRCAEADDKTALKAFTAGLRDCFFKYMINANTWKTYSEVMAQAYNHASAEAKTYQEKPPTTILYQQVGGGSQTHLNEKTSTFQTAVAPPHALHNASPNQQTYQFQGKRKDFHPHHSHFCKKSKGHYPDNQGYRHNNARPQAVNAVGQTRVKIPPTPRYETYTPLNATCAAIYPSIAHLIPKPKPRHPDYTPPNNAGMFCCYHEHNSHDSEKCIILRDRIEALAREGKIDQFLLHPQRDNRNQRQVNVIYSISGGTPISESSNRAMKNSERSLRPGHQVFHVEDIRGGKYQKPNWDPICFYPEEERGIIYPHNDPLIVEAHIANFDVRRILVDTGASVNIMFAEAFRALSVAEHLLDRSISPLISFSGDIVQPLGSIHLPFTIGTGPYTATITTNFLVVDCPTAYNVIFGRTGINDLKAMVSTHMLLMKFPTPHGNGYIRGDQLSARSCYNTSVKQQHLPGPKETLSVHDQVTKTSLDEANLDLPDSNNQPDDPRDDSFTQQAQPAEELEKVPISRDYPDRMVKIGTTLSPPLRLALISFLKENTEVFAWSYEDMPGISPDVICHRLSIDPKIKPVRQKRRSYDAERYEAMKAEVEKLKGIGFVREVNYPTWVANVVLVKKNPTKESLLLQKVLWRMCVDYTDLNKGCPKDSFPLPLIDRLIDSTAGCELLSFMDAYSGYNQILMNPSDQEHTAFTTDRGLYCYKVMPFGLKNAGATYQRLVNSMFAEQIGKSMEVYVDDMLVKSKHADQHITNLYETFTILKRYRMRLNPNKCAFGVGSGKFLGFMISQRGIEANPEKIKAILDMKEPVTSKDIQSLTGKVAALTRFISKATDKCAPFFKALKGSRKYITWTDECAGAFKNLKEYMSKAPLLSKPEVGDILIIYLSVSASAVSSVLIRKDGNIERPVYYASKALQDAETRYSNIEKLALALVMSARKLRPYFQAHSIIVLTNYPLRQILQSPDTSGRMIKWAIALGEFDISYQPKPAEKGQAVADFIADFTYPVDIASTPEAVASLPSEAQKVESTTSAWSLYVDGSSNQQGCGAGLVLTTPDKVAMEYALRFKFKASNNEAEYEALLAGLRLAKHLGVKQIDIFSDSQLVVNQVTNNFDAKDSSMAAYLAQTQLLLKHFHYQITQVPRAANSHADALARLASAVEDKIGRKIHVELLATPSTMAAEVCNLQRGDSWITPIYNFLAHGILPNDKVQAKQIRYKSTRYLIINDQLYKRGFSLPYLRCLTPAEAEIVLREIHEGVCGDHAGSRSLAHKTFSQGYYWPTLHQDAIKVSRSCDKCQRYAAIPHSPPEPLTPMISPWPFAQWGLDLIGPMPAGKGKVCYAVVAVDYFTKWAEVEPLATITEAKIEDFVWKNILCRFGIPNAIVTDNGRQFDNKKFRLFCSKFNINLCFASPAHPQSNGQVEAINKIIKRTLKTSLDKAKGCWPEFVPQVLWSYRTSYRTSTGETPFSLAFGTEAVVPVELEQATFRVQNYIQSENDKQLTLNLDLVEEHRNQAHLRNVAYKQRISNYYDSRVKPRSFKIGDWVLKKRLLCDRVPSEGTLSPNWDGPYEVIGISRPGSYTLRSSDGKTLGHPWNADHLKYYYK
ncbi:hypothetical protein ACFX2I_030941 [Malus domestica]